MSPLSYVLIISSYNFGDMISCLRVHMPPIFVECPPSNGGSVLLVETETLGSRGFGESLWAGKYFDVLI